MKRHSTLVALCALIFSAGFVSAEEHSVPFITSLSTTTIRGYIDTGTHWQRHVCRPVWPVRPQRVVQRVAGSPTRTIGHNVRCRHGVVFVPNAGAYITPNRSSRFWFFSSSLSMVWIDYQTYSVFIEANRLHSQLGWPGPSYPPLPPTPLSTNFPPLLINYGYGSVSMRYEIFSEEQRLLRQLPPEERARLLNEISEIRARWLRELEQLHSSDTDQPAERRWFGRSPIPQPPDRFVREPQ